MRAAGIRAYYFPGALFFGIFAPACRASDKPIAMACSRLFTVFPERPLLSVPRFISCSACLTFRLPMVVFAATRYVLTLKVDRTTRWGNYPG